MERIGIVGPSYGFSETFMMDARKTIALVIKDHLPCVLVSGGADGIDSWSEETAVGLGCKTDIKRPHEGHEHWPKKGECPTPESCYGYKARNIDIAESVVMLYCIPIIADGAHCYHCHTKGHRPNGGCWTLNYAKDIGVKTKLIPL